MSHLGLRAQLEMSEQQLRLGIPAAWAHLVPQEPPVALHPSMWVHFPALLLTLN